MLLYIAGWPTGGCALRLKLLATAVISLCLWMMFTLDASHWYIFNAYNLKIFFPLALCTGLPFTCLFLSHTLAQCHLAVFFFVVVIVVGVSLCRHSYIFIYIFIRCASSFSSISPYICIYTSICRQKKRGAHTHSFT